MIGTILKKVARAAVAQPCDYMGEGAPNEWEFRLAPDEEMVAVYNPHTGKWVIFREVVTLAEVTSLTEMDRNTADWAQFVEVIDDD